MNHFFLKPIAYSVLSASLLILSGCAGDSKKVQEGEATAYDLYSQNKPETTLADTGIPSGNVITSAIVGVYVKTIDLEGKYKKGIENSKVASTLEKVRSEQGDAAYEKDYKELGAEDKAEYNEFLNSNINTLEVAVGYASEATKLAVGIMGFNYKDYISNPMAAFSSIAAIDKAKEQILYTEKALEFMVETRTIYQAMLEHKGR